MSQSSSEEQLGIQYKRLTGRQCILYEGDAADQRCLAAGKVAFADPEGVWLTAAAKRDAALYDRILRHEFAHLAQFNNAAGGKTFSPERALEEEATRFQEEPGMNLSDVRLAADPRQSLGLWWLVPMAAAAYVLLRPNVANAPGPGDKTYPNVSTAQVAGEAFALFAVPGAAYSVAGRLGLRWLGQSAVAGAAANMSLRAVSDVSGGQFSGPGVYIFDMITGAAIGMVTAGAIVLLGKGICVSLDWLATQGMRRADILITRKLAEAAANGPLDEIAVSKIMGERAMAGRLAERWLERRGMVVLYRGQGMDSKTVLSPIAREQGVGASQALEERMRAAGITSEEIAKYMAQWHNQPVPPFATVPSLAGQPLGGVGIPHTRIPGIAANFGETGVVYVVRLPKGATIKVPKWGLSLENEHAVLHSLPEGSIVQKIPASRIPSLTLDEAGKMIVPGN